MSEEQQRLPPPATEPHWFWKIFGGTVVSVIVVVILTFIQIVHNQLNELRNDVLRYSRESSDCLKQSDFSSRMQPVWTNLRDFSGTKEKVTVLEAKSTAQEESNKLLQKEVTSLRERIVVLEATIKRNTESSRDK